MAAQLLRFLLIPASVLVWSVAGADSPDRAIDEPVPLPEDERRQITLSLLERYPELASSPGVKAAAAPLRRPGTTIMTNVIFYPHTEHHGIKEAFEAWCQWASSSQSWTCNDITIRRYLSLASQDFEVRVKGAITSEGALALVEASRRDLQSSVIDGADLPNTAIMIFPAGDGSYRITWGTPEGYSRLAMLARLTNGGDSTNPDDWQAKIISFAE